MGILTAAVAQARPRFLIIPIEDVEFAHHRVARSAWPQEAAPKPMPVRRQPGPPRPRPVMVEIEESESAPAPSYYADRRADGPAPGFAIPASIRTAEEQIAAGSGPSPLLPELMLLIMELILEDMELLDGT